MRVTDSASASTTAALSVTINPAALKVTTSSLPAGTVGVAYSQGLSASGGTAPYVWSLASGSLPTGLSLGTGGTISGTPGSAGSSNFTVRVTDSALASTTGAVSVTINPAALKVTTSSLPAGTVGVAYSQGLSASGGTAPYVVVCGERIAAGWVEPGGGRDDLGHAWDCGIEQLYGAGDGQCFGDYDGSAVGDDQSAGFGDYDVVAACRHGRCGVLARARRFGRDCRRTSWSVASGSLPAGLSLAAGGTISGTPGQCRIEQLYGARDGQRFGDLRRQRCR